MSPVNTRLSCDVDDPTQSTDFINTVCDVPGVLSGCPGVEKGQAHVNKKVCVLHVSHEHLIAPRRPGSPHLGSCQCWGQDRVSWPWAHLCRLRTLVSPSHA